MNLSASNQATLNFYRWEYWGRGYYLFDEQVDIEPPYVPFYHRRYTESPQIDDGRISSLFERVVSLIEGKKKEGAPKEETALVPNPVNSIPKLTGFSIFFGREQEISSVVSLEFLNMLSLTDYPVSFEILGNFESITVQIVCSVSDRDRIQSHIRAYFPLVVIRETSIYNIGFDLDSQIAVADFGLSDEFMRPIQTVPSFAIDPLTSIIATLDILQEGDTILFQILFKGVRAPWARDITYSVSDGRGGSFFPSNPEMLPCAIDKVSLPLFSCVMRIVAQGSSDSRSQYLTQDLARNITSVSRSEYNKLIPLSNEGYCYEEHLMNVIQRSSNRLGMILNSNELVTFVHYPNKSIVSEKLHPYKNKTKSLPEECKEQKYILGFNEHNGVEEIASIDDATFGKHIVIGGSTGTGKTHLLKQLISQDLELRNSAFVIDAHGDLVQDILLTISDDDKEKVVFINIVDEEYSFGFNIFTAPSDAEKTVLVSDLASAFSDTWISTGDRIQSVLQKTISTLIYSKKEASLLDMKRFLLEQDFRDEFLSSLDDPVLLYYWHNEFPLVRRNELTPLMLRIDAFMQTRLLRNIFAQTRGIDFNALVEERKLVLFQLSVGLIGLENSKFLAKLLIAKINQIAFSRQSLTREKRYPIHLYIDEANHYANTSAVEQILSGARKYNLSLVLVLQHLEQVHTGILNSILTNTATQIFFRQSEKDGKRIAPSFSYFEPTDFMDLDLGEALVRVNKRANDFSMRTKPLPEKIPKEKAESTKSYIINRSRERFAMAKEEVQILLSTLLPSSHHGRGQVLKNVKDESFDVGIKKKDVSTSSEGEMANLEGMKKDQLKRVEEQESISEHQSLQNFVATVARQLGFVAEIEKELDSGKRIDVSLSQNDLKIAVEVSVTNTPGYELGNIEKCIDAHYDVVMSLSNNGKHLAKIKKCVENKLTRKWLEKVFFLHPNEISEFLSKYVVQKEPTSEIVQGFRVTTEYSDYDKISKKNLKQHLSRIFFKKKGKR